MKAALTATNLTTWNFTASNQPCATYTGQPTGRYGSAGAAAWTGVTCAETYSTTLVTTRVVTAGITALSLPNVLLRGSIPAQVRKEGSPTERTSAT